jgi:hypothetical protein
MFGFGVGVGVGVESAWGRGGEVHLATAELHLATPNPLNGYTDAGARECGR